MYGGKYNSEVLQNVFQGKYFDLRREGSVETASWKILFILLSASLAVTGPNESSVIIKRAFLFGFITFSKFYHIFLQTGLVSLNFLDKF